MNLQENNDILLQITDIALISGLSSPTSLNNKARNQNWPFIKKSHSNGSPLHLYPLSRLPDEVQLAWAKWDITRLQETTVKLGVPPEKALATLTQLDAETALKWPTRLEYYGQTPKERQKKGQSKKQYNNKNWGLCPSARQVLLNRFLDISDADSISSVKEPALEWGEQDQQSNEFVYVPHYKISPKIGVRGEINSEQIINHLAFHKVWVHNHLRVGVKDLALVNVIGDSMEPTLCDKDLILIDLSQRDIKNGYLYVLKIDQNLIVKRLEVLMTGEILVKSDNREYKDQKIQAKKHISPKVLGRVIWFGREI